MNRVSYQSVLGPAAPATIGVYVRLGPSAIGTRKKDARREVTIPLSKPQARWLNDATELSGPGVDEGTVLRAIVDLGMELDVDWPLIASGAALRSAVRDAVMVRRPTEA